VTITAPIEIGFALDDYYEKDNGHESAFGYMSFGASASVPLAFVPECLGSWSFTATGKGYVLSNTLKAANDGDRMSPVFTGSLTFEF